MRLSLLVVAGCATPLPPQRCPTSAPAAASAPAVVAVNTATARINQVLDDWHRAAANANEKTYFEHMTSDAIFLGTDATERWDKAAFRAFAHPHFARGKAWSFTPTRRAVILSEQGTVAWFDEDLATPNLGPARGSGVLLKQQGVWRIAHYNLTLTIPNASLDAVKKVLAPKSPPASAVQ
ncbi:MAG TPA: DUF4440 domain-containing protein [Sorangium sp.]|nr:DUF4440 domain-containing protein [Sorangium sp.]